MLKCFNDRWFSIMEILLAVIILFFTTPVYAADLYFFARAEDILVDDVFVVEARLSSPDELINVVDGSILFDKEKLEVKELSTGGSVLNLWAQGPTFSNSAGTISFVGGTPNGFQGEELILKTIFRAKNIGEAKIFLSDDFALFLSDGKGTRLSPQARQLTLNIRARPAQVSPRDEWKGFIEEDITTPEFIEAIISKDQSVFDGKYFVSFFATDKDSGIAYYEIKEGERDFVQAMSPYVLEDQTLAGGVQIKVVDAAGNEQITEAVIYVPATPFYKNIVFWAIAFLIIALIVYGWRAIWGRQKTKG